VKSTTDRILIVVAIMLAAALIVVVAGSMPDGIIRVGDTAPDFKLVTEDGKTFTRANFGGKLLVLNFWASWCTPCLEEVPSLDVFQREFGRQGVVVLGVSVDKNEKLYRSFLEQFRVSFETARDPSWDIATSYGTFQLPETYVIDQSGKVVQKVISAQNWMDPDFLQSVRKLL
jgi:cytochrome c biogenesis protein CcmG/thiol:disulfide interchange protein DsbE